MDPTVVERLDDDRHPATAGVGDSILPGSPNALGPGFIVWESNRNGRWRLWTTDLEGGEPRQLTPDEGARIHCCPHISPDGEAIVFLSLPADQKLYPEGGAVGRMDLIQPDGRGQRTLLEAARNYFENRAAVWRGTDEIVFVEANGATALLHLATGRVQRLTAEVGGDPPWLLDSSLTWAASGIGGFGEFDPKSRRVAARNELPGCQPYFSGDGRWVFWVQAPGGPLAFRELATGRDGTLLKKSDPRLPADRGYLYFPMLSRDARLLAFGASPNQFDHFESDYDIFVVETDPATLEILGKPVPITEHPATDRFPDVWVEPLPLGRWQGEAPFTVQLEAPASRGSWHWELGDGTSAAGNPVEHHYDLPGRYPVVATTDTGSLRGRVVVDEAAPPHLLSVSLFQGGRQIALLFDEPVAIEELDVRLDSGIEIEDTHLDRHDHRLLLQLTAPIESADRLELAGVVDRAQIPNVLPATTLTIDAPVWPSRTAGLALVFETASAPNLVFDTGLGADTTSRLDARGRARLDHHFTLLPSGGFFVASDPDATRVVRLGKATNEITIEAVLEAPEPIGERPAVILASGLGNRRNFSLEQRGDHLVFVSRSRRSRAEPAAEVTLFRLAVAEPTHVAVAYAPGRLQAYSNGELVVDDDALQQGFHHWREAPLTIGAFGDGKSPWKGRAEGLAIYNRVLEAEEVAENAHRYRALLASRQPLTTWRLRAALIDCAAVPDLADIRPYREALRTCVWRVEEVLAGAGLSAGDRLRVAQWAVLDGAQLEARTAGKLTTSILEVSRFVDNPQLESVYLAEAATEHAELELFYSAAP